MSDIMLLFISVVLVVLTFLAVMLISGNNLSACVGPAIGSRIISKRFGTILGAAGFSTGLLVQGSSMTRSVEVLLPSATSELRVVALLVAILIFIIADIARVPMSFSMCLVGLLAGLSIGNDVPASVLFSSEVAVMWLIAPLVAIALSFLLIRLINRTWPTNFWQRIQTYKVLLISLSFSTAYVLGANTLGLVVATSGFTLSVIIAAIIAIFIGSFYLSGGTIRRISQEFFLMRYTSSTAILVTSTILVEVATFFNIPLSNTQTASAAVLGTGLSYKTKFVSLKPFLIIIASWIIAPILSFAIGVLISYAPIQ
jgi:inorganic phosphate transporter, PiT family